MPNTNAFSVVTEVFRSQSLSLAAALAADRAYAEAVGHPEYHQAFGLENPQMVAMNLAGIYAADTTANMLVALDVGFDGAGKIDPEEYVAALKRIVADDIADTERLIAKNAANLAWRAGQPFRDIATGKPLNRIERDINMQFNLLPPDEEDKDLVQVVAGARFLLEQIEGTQS